MFPSPEQESSERREKLLRELSHIEIYTRRVANQAPVGDYRSSLRGEGVDFIEHKKYVAGDNWRRIDWNVFARTGQPYVRICYEEKEMLALIVADLSPSMDLGSEEFSKKDVLVEAVATIAFSAAAANMSVGLVGGAESVDLYLRPRKGRRQAWHILEGLLQYRSRSRRTNLEQLLRYALDSLRRPCIFFVLSDFIVIESLLEQPLLSYIAAHHDLVPVLIEDRLERELPEVHSYVRFRDLEVGEEVLVSLSPRNCQALAGDMQRRRRAIRQAFLRLGAIPMILGTGQSPLVPLMEFFLQRKKSNR